MLTRALNVSVVSLFVCTIFMSLGRNEMKMILAGNEKKAVSKRNMGFHGHYMLLYG